MLLLVMVRHRDKGIVFWKRTDLIGNKPPPITRNRNEATHTDKGNAIILISETTVVLDG